MQAPRAATLAGWVRRRVAIEAGQPQLVPQQRWFNSPSPMRAGRGAPYADDDASGMRNRMSQDEIARKLFWRCVAVGVLGAGVFGTANTYLNEIGFPEELEAVVVDIKYVFERYPHLRPLAIRLVLAQNEQHVCNVWANMSPANTASLRWYVRREGMDMFSELIDVIEKVQGAHNNIGTMDLWTLAAAVAIEEMGGPKVVERWKFGRIDAESYRAVFSRDMLPRMLNAGEAGCLKNLAEFSRMGFTTREFVALMGMHHDVGRITDEILPFPVTNDPKDKAPSWTRTPDRVTGEYFTNLYNETWVVDDTAAYSRYVNAAADSTGGGDGVWGWVLRLLRLRGGGKVEADATPTPPGSLMMLPADIALLQNSATRAVVREYAQNPGLWEKDVADAWTKLTSLNMEPHLYEPVPRSSYKSLILFTFYIVCWSASYAYERATTPAEAPTQQPDKETVAYVKARARELAQELDGVAA